ncbi:MAG: cytidylate kinase-like family protein [bacterium]
MAIITISRGSFSRGKEIAENVASKLGYKIIAREILLEASKEFNIPSIKLIRAVHDAPSILDKYTYGKEKYIAYIQSEILEHFLDDNVVYHGLAGHFFVKDIAHVLKVRIIADMEDRVKLEMEREGISRNEALHNIKKDDLERGKWSQHLYGIDTMDPHLYDLVIHIHKLATNEAVDIICSAARLDRFQKTAESESKLKDLYLAAKVKANLISLKPDVEVTARDGVVHVKTRAPMSEVEQLETDIKSLTECIEGVKEIKVDIRPKSSMGI